jgi:hypothetical protein
MVIFLKQENEIIKIQCITNVGKNRKKKELVELKFEKNVRNPEVEKCLYTIRF